MAVHRSKRYVAFSQFEDATIKMCKDTRERLNPLPERYKKLIVERTLTPAASATTNVILGNEQNARTERGLELRSEYLALAVEDILAMQHPVIAVMNLRHMKESSCENWVEECNEAIRLIYGVAKWEDEPPKLLYLPRLKMQTLNFLQKMSELHEYSYQKIAHAPKEYASTIGIPVARHMDAALYEVIAANVKMPETRKEADTRAEHLQLAIDNINASQRTLYGLCNLMDYSENTIDHWSGLMSDELKLIEGLKKSDKIRYKKLC